MSIARRGFTLVELMIVVASIGTLAAIGIPAYQNYTIRAQVTDGLSLADGWKVAVAEFFVQTDGFPTTAQLTNSGHLASSGKYVSSITSTHGAITITYGGAQLDATALPPGHNQLSLSPYTDSSNDFIWVCGTAPPPPGLKLTVGAIPGTTSVKSQYLPGTCRP